MVPSHLPPWVRVSHPALLGLPAWCAGGPALWDVSRWPETFRARREPLPLSQKGTCPAKDIMGSEFDPRCLTSIQPPPPTPPIPNTEGPSCS